jgi:hypothetical protein
MNQRIKLIWDFRGPNAAPTAAHHVIHLKEFVVAEKLQNTLCDIETVHETHHIAFLVVDKIHMDDLRERLKPNRGQLYQKK